MKKPKVKSVTARIIELMRQGQCHARLALIDEKNAALHLRIVDVLKHAIDDLINTRTINPLRASTKGRTSE